MRRTAAILIVMMLSAGLATLLVTPVDAVGTPQGGSSYWMVGKGGSVYAFGSMKSCGHPRVVPQYGSSVVDIVATPDGQGYWTLNSQGVVEFFACASMPRADRVRYMHETIQLTEIGADGGSPVSISPSPDGSGMFVFTDIGHVFAYGNARWHWSGDLSHTAIDAYIVGGAVTPSGRGYYIVEADGDVFTFGDARFHGSLGGVPLNKPVVGMILTPDGRGYWLTAADGGVFAFGDATFYGSLAGKQLNRPIVGIAASPSGRGYVLVASDGGVFTFGDATFHGSLGANRPAQPITSISVIGTSRSQA